MPDEGAKQRGLQPILAITFDFWDTLYYDTRTATVRRRLIADAIAEEGPAPTLERVDAAKALAWQKFREAWAKEYRTPSAGEWVDWAFAELGVALKPSRKAKLVTDIKQAMYQQGPTPIPGALECVAQLAKRYALAVISDAVFLTGAELRQILVRDGVSAHFSHLTFSDELGISKPHPQTFLSTLEVLGVSPHQAVHIGDSPQTDILGAQSVGMRTIRFLGGTSAHPSAEIHADAEFHSYGELGLILEAMSRCT
jgi:HAD superfamily hydrolase (TIGR01509 family)